MDRVKLIRLIRAGKRIRKGRMSIALNKKTQEIEIRNSPHGSLACPVSGVDRAASDFLKWAQKEIWAWSDNIWLNQERDPEMVEKIKQVLDSDYSNLDWKIYDESRILTGFSGYVPEILAFEQELRSKGLDFDFEVGGVSQSELKEPRCGEWGIKNVGDKTLEIWDTTRTSGSADETVQGNWNELCAVLQRNKGKGYTFIFVGRFHQEDKKNLKWCMDWTDDWNVKFKD